jgi:SAM-dependent methyltransferase
MVVTCPVCGGTEFGDYNGRMKVACVGCRSLERGRLQFMIMKHLGLPRTGSRILHLAPEPHLFKVFTQCSGALYHPCDYEPDNRNYKRLGGHIYPIDLCQDIFRFPTSAFDLIVHNHVLEHIPCAVAPVLEEHKRILAPGGMLIFSVPFRGAKTDEDWSPEVTLEEKLRRFGQADHVRIFGTDDFLQLTQQVFGRNIVFDPGAYWTDEQLAGWAVPPELTKRISGVTNFVWQKADGT